MTIEEAIRILDPETRRKTVKAKPVLERINADQEACRLAVAALRAQQEQEDPKPLTLDELQEMDREPVWVVWLNSGIRSQWFVVGSYDWRMMEFDDNMILERYGKRNAWDAWIAFRHKPKEERNELEV